MPGLVPGIHVLMLRHRQGVDGRNKSGHDEAFVNLIPSCPITTARPEHRHWVYKAAPALPLTYVKSRNQREFRHHLANAVKAIR
jgi:hypothetical protein